jgi:hypothetical protein
MKDNEKQIEELAQCKNSNGYTCHSCGVKLACDRYILAKEIYDKGSVVLTMEEYERITKELITEQRAKEIAKEYFGVVRKETAETILKEFANIKVNGSSLEDYIVAVKVVDKIDELAKQFGVEIKE